MGVLKPSYSLLVLLVLNLCDVQAQGVDDLTIHYEGMVVTDIQERKEVVRTPFYRHSLMVQLGRGAWSAGLIGALTRGTSSYGPDEEGLMVTAGYGRLLSDKLRVETFGRVGVTKGHRFGSPLYATDTDLRVNLVGFLPDGWGWLQDRPLYPSAYAGVIVNRYGRVQFVGGSGIWWNQWNVYLTGFTAVNGVDNPLKTNRNADIAFANLKNAGFSISASRGIGPLTVGLRHNIPIRHGGYDTTLTLTYQRFFGGG